MSLEGVPNLLLTPQNIRDGTMPDGQPMPSWVKEIVSEVVQEQADKPAGPNPNVIRFSKNDEEGHRN